MKKRRNYAFAVSKPTIVVELPQENIDTGNKKEGEER